MRVLVANSADIGGKYRAIVGAWPQVWTGSVLDIGCRGSRLRDELGVDTRQYCGLDRDGDPDIVADLECGLPFGDATFDCVAALDVLEHLERLHAVFDDVLRVARLHVVVSLPNAYDFVTRTRMVMGRSLSAKYGLPTEAPPDRHRWFFSLREASAFMRMRCQRHGFSLIDECCLLGPRRKRLVGTWLAGTLPNLLSTTYVCCLRRK